MTPLRQVQAGVLNIAYHETGSPAGAPVILLHGFPYSPHACQEAATLLPANRVIIPFLRGYGPTRFLSAGTPRSGEQAVLGTDLLALMDALNISQAVLAGYDWGGRAACVVAALHPHRVTGLVTGGGYNIQDIPNAGKPHAPEAEHRLWYQYYFQTERGRAGLAQDRNAFCRHLWTLWSPDWRFTDQTYNATAEAFQNPDFVDVVIHSYRHRFGHAPSDPAALATEAALARQPPIAVPTITLHGASDGVSPPETSASHAAHFTSRYQRRVLPRIGHNIPQEAPADFAAAIQDLAAS